MKTQQESIFSSKTLTYFLQLSETMNYTLAAQQLGITQPALTQQIKKLERTVGAPLFYSVGKKLYMSEAGRTMLDATKEINQVVNAATDRIQRTSESSNGKIQIGLLASVEDSAFCAFIAQYYQAHPDIEVSLRMLTRHELFEQLENNLIDLAIMYLPDSAIKNWKVYESKKIIDESLLFLHHNEALVGRKRVKMADASAEPWAGYPEDYYLSSLLREAFKNKLVDYPKVVAQFTTPYQLTQFSNRTGVNTALPNSFYQAHKDQIKAHAVAFEPQINFELAFVYRQHKNEIPRIKQFLDSFDEYLAKDDYLSRVAQNRVKLSE